MLVCLQEHHPGRPGSKHSSADRFGPCPLRRSERGVLFAVPESGSVWQPQPAAPHAGTGAEGPTLRDAAQGLPEEAS